MSTPLVTVITVCYNAVSLLEETMLSVLGQDYPNLEYLIIDGASTDGTLNIIKKYADRVTFVSEPDKGIYDAMNKGLRMAKGEWVNFMNAGDAFVEDDVLTKVFADRLIPDSVQVIAGTTWDVYPDRRELRALSPIGELSMYIPFCHQSAFTRFDVHNPWFFDTNYRMAADYALFYGIREKSGDAAFLLLEDLPVACYRMEGSTSYVNMRRTKGEYLHIRSFHRDWQWWKEWLKWRLLDRY